MHMYTYIYIYIHIDVYITPAERAPARKFHEPGVSFAAMCSASLSYPILIMSYLLYPISYILY